MISRSPTPPSPDRLEDRQHCDWWVVEGTTGGGDRFGFVANEIGSLKIGGASIPLTNGAYNDGVPKQLAATTGDVFLREVIGTPVAA